MVTLSRTLQKQPKQQRRQIPKARSNRDFNYELDYKHLDLRQHPEIYRVGKGEQGVLMVEPYKSEILPYWKFKTPPEARQSVREITRLFHNYKRQGDFVGMDMARKFIQMGYTRARRYANHKSGRKYSESGKLLPLETDEIKARSAEIFLKAWKKLEKDPVYSRMKSDWKLKYG